MNKQKKNKVLRVASLALVLTLITTCLLANTLAKYTKTLSGYDSARVAKFDFAAAIETYREDGSTGDATDLTGAGAEIDLFATAYTSKFGTPATSVTTVESGNGDKVVAPGVYGAFEFTMTGESEVATRLTLTIKETDASDADTTIPLFYCYDSMYYANAAAIVQYGAKLGITDDIYINISNSDTSPNYTQITAAKYGGNFTDLAAAVAANAATALGSTNGIIPPNTDLSDFYPAVDWYWPFEVVEVGDATSTDYDVTDGYSNYYRLLSDTNDTALGVAAVTAENWVKLELGATLTQVD